MTSEITKTAPLRRPSSDTLELVELGSGRALQLCPGERAYVVGSRFDCDLVVSDPYVSTQHLSLTHSDGEIKIRDLASKNGTFIAGARIETARVGPGTRLRIGGAALDLRSADGSGFGRLLGDSDRLVAAKNTANRAARGDVSILILGETGTGKELMARAIHDGSPRSAGPFVAINCGAIPRELVASELFGHVRGAFTGAIAGREGVFAQADGGTLFLDELGELPAEQQVHLLRVLETSIIRPVGGHDEIAVDVRLVAATNVADIDGPGSRFRADLYHRIATVVVELPPLRVRPEDIPTLVRSFVAELEGRYGPRTIEDSTIEALKSLRWPGNVRELRQAVHRAMALSSSELTLDALVPRPMRQTMWLGTEASDPDDSRQTLLPIDVAVRELMSTAYRRHGSIRRAAASLGMAKSTFADRARRYGIVKKAS